MLCSSFYYLLSMYIALHKVPGFREHLFYSLTLYFFIQNKIVMKCISNLVSLHACILKLLFFYMHTRPINMF